MSPKRAALTLLLAVLLVAGGFVLGRASVPEVELATAVTTSPPPTTAPETTAVMVTEPPGNVYPVSHVIAGHCEQLGDFEVTLHGIVSRNPARFRSHISINVIEIRASAPDFYQLIEGLSTDQEHLRDNYGFSLDDWNGDGYIDLSLLIHEGGIMMNSPNYFWLWDTSNSRFVKNTELMEISESATVGFTGDNAHRIFAFTHYGASKWGGTFYDYLENHFIAVEMQECLWEEQENGFWGILTRTYHLIDGEWTVTSETREPTEN